MFHIWGSYSLKVKIHLAEDLEKIFPARIKVIAKLNQSKYTFLMNE